MRNNKYSETINDALKSVKEFSNGNVVIGDTLVTQSGTTIIPVSKITVGLLSGTGEYGEVKVFSLNKNYPKSNAGGGVITVKPFGFLIEKGKKIKFLSVPSDYLDKAFDSIVSFLDDKNEK